MINQANRTELCRRILAGDKTAMTALADLYRREGYVSLTVPLVRAAAGDSYSEGYAKHHALIVLGLPLTNCPCFSCRH